MLQITVPEFFSLDEVRRKPILRALMLKGFTDNDGGKTLERTLTAVIEGTDTGASYNISLWRQVKPRVDAAQAPIYMDDYIQVRIKEDGSKYVNPGRLDGATAGLVVARKRPDDWTFDIGHAINVEGESSDRLYWGIRDYRQ